MLHQDQVDWPVRVRFKADAFRVNEARTCGRHRQGGADAVAIDHDQHLHRAIPLQERLLINAEQGGAIQDVGIDLLAEVEGAMLDVARTEARRLHEGVEGVGAVRTQRQEDAGIRVGSVVVVNDGLRLGRIVGDGQHLGRNALLSHGIGEALAALVQAGVPHLVVDAHALGAALGRQLQAAQIATLILVLAQVGHVVNAILDGACTGIVSHHRDAGIQRPLDRLAEQIGVSHGQGNAIRLRRRGLVNQLRHLLQVELVGAEDGDVDVHVIRSLADARLHRAPEGVPGTQRVLDEDEVQHCLGARFRHNDLNRHFFFDDLLDLDGLLDNFLDRHLFHHLDDLRCGSRAGGQDQN